MIEAQLREARTLYAAGLGSSAEAIYDKILLQDPDEPRALCLRGLIRRDEGDILGAERNFRRALKVAPGLGLAYQMLGDLLYNAKHLIMAADIYERGLKQEPNNIAILGNLAHTRLGLGELEACLTLSQRVVELQGNHQESWFHIGASLCRLGRADDAIDPLLKALALNPNCLRSRAALCAVFMRCGRLHEAEEIVAAVAPLLEVKVENLAQFSEVLVWLGEVKTASRILEAFMARDSSHAAVWSLLAKLYIVADDERRGTALLAKAAELFPENAEICLTLGLQLFKFSDYQRGLDLYRRRWQISVDDPREGWWQIPAPAWNGEVIHDGALMVWAEQGIGDLAMFAGLFQQLPDRAPRVMIETNGRFRRLLERSFPWAEFYQRDQLEPDFVTARNVRAHAPIGDLPRLLDSDMECLPARGGYLVPDAATMWRLRLRYQEQFPGKIIVGISWRSGNKTSATTRSAALDLWQQILRQSDLAFVSLQYGAVEVEVAEANRRLGTELFVDPEIDPLADLDVFAAQIAAVDLVISVDNSTVHFAGAMGKPCWVLLPYVADWRWLRERDDTIWYSSVRLFRQVRPEDWAGAVAAVDKALCNQSIDFDSQLCAFMHRAAQQVARVPGSGDAELFYRRILQKCPQDAVALNGLGRVGLETGHVAAARPMLAAATILLPSEPAFAHYLAHADRLMASPQHEASSVLPAWHGNAELEARLFFYSTGDVSEDIKAVAGLAELRQRVGHLVVECHPSLVPLLARQNRRISVFPANSLSAGELAGFDLTSRASLAELDICRGAEEPWLRADPVRIAEHRARFEHELRGRKIIGLAWTQEGIWAGAASRDWLALTLLDLRPVFDQRDCAFVVFQDGVDKFALAANVGELGGRFLVDRSFDFRTRPDAFAAALSAVDLLIAPLGATAWLAAALGVPSCALVKAAEISRLPHGKLFRQSPNGSWQRAVDDLVETLRG